MNTTSRSPPYFEDLKIGHTFVTDKFELTAELTVATSKHPVTRTFLEGLPHE